MVYPDYYTGITYLESSISLIQRLSINDEERDSRLSVLHTTYQKSSNEVTGCQYLISVLENVAINNQFHARDTLREIINIISAGRTNQNAIIILTEQVMADYTFKTMRDNEEIYCYDTARGVYLRFADSIIREYVEILNPKIKTYEVNEIIQKIKRRTYIARAC